MKSCMLSNNCNKHASNSSHSTTIFSRSEKWLQLGSWLVSQSVRDCGKVHDDWQFFILSSVQILLPWKRLFVQLNVMDWSGKQVSLILILAKENGWSVIHSHHGTQCIFVIWYEVYQLMWLAAWEMRRVLLLSKTLHFVPR